MATAEQVRVFRSRNSDLVTLAQRDLSDFWAALNIDGNPLLVRDALLDFFPEIVQAYGDTAAILAADFYDELRDVGPSAARFNAIMADVPDLSQSEAVARWGLTPLFKPEPDGAGALDNLLGAAQRLVLQSGRDTIANSAARDSVRTGFARVPSGPTTCEWCLMLASRGAVYASKQSAGGDMSRYHGHCDCVPTPMRSLADLPDGYNPAALQAEYMASTQ